MESAAEGSHVPQLVTLFAYLPLLIWVTVASRDTVLAAGQLSYPSGISVDASIAIGLPAQLPQVFERSDLARLPHTTVTVRNAQGKSTVYSGILLHDLLERAGLSTGARRNLASYVMVEAVQEKHVLFALAECDTTLTRKRILLADAKDGKPMMPPEGPFRIVVSDEQMPARWVKQVWAIYVVPDS